MDVIKTEPEVDPLVIETSDNTDTDQKKLFSEKRILLDVDMTRIKMESMDNSDDLKLEMAFEQTAMPTDISIVKTGVELLGPSTTPAIEDFTSALADVIPRETDWILDRT
ncbi:uncharacterized protein [Periplaneta americana]|uniref:uncharacterized protein isoform X2 n=1 Tax=Periplaneta americana TaxID=6978 RepID=UPI0037E6FA48